MKLSTYHLHTTYCDGKNTAEEMVLKAIELGCPEIGFSGHAYMDFDGSWCMSIENTERYKKEITALKEKYKDKINIYCGIEQDYFAMDDGHKYDYVIGSVHRVRAPGGDFVDVDNTAEEQLYGVDEYYDGDYMAFAEDYFRQMADVVNKTKCHIVGHFDLLAKFNENDEMFDTYSHRYIKAWKEALDALLENKDIVFEVNTGAIGRGYRTSPYPEPAMLEYIKRGGGTVIVTSDCHNAAMLDCGVKAAYELVESIGVKCIDFEDFIKEGKTR